MYLQTNLCVATGEFDYHDDAVLARRHRAKSSNDP